MKISSWWRHLYRHYYAVYSIYSGIVLDSVVFSFRLIRLRQRLGADTVLLLKVRLIIS